MRIRKPVANRFKRSSVALSPTYVVHSDGSVTVLGWGPGIALDGYRPVAVPTATTETEIVL